MAIERFAERSPSPDRLRPPQPWDTRKGQWRSRAGLIQLVSTSLSFHLLMSLHARVLLRASTYRLDQKKSQSLRLNSPDTAGPLKSRESLVKRKTKLSERTIVVPLVAMGEKRTTQTVGIREMKLLEITRVLIVTFLTMRRTRGVRRRKRRGMLEVQAKGRIQEVLPLQEGAAEEVLCTFSDPFA
ncbi:hypothetical protein CSUI_000220 [Cystoisospora suis]|uniref:Uncharacterized protein n=1 Tax=Cystoisospora suis TaxID=483139 RepID=A0A2C6LEU4_9APIC|nr:hypothetical protein CSUI_000220 [Cystoisospora suis]